MNDRELPFHAIPWPDASALRQRYPGLGDRLLVELVNGIQVSREIIAFQRSRGVVAQLLDHLLLRRDARQQLLDTTLLAGQQRLLSLVQEIQIGFSISSLALVETQRTIMRLADQVRQLESRSLTQYAEFKEFEKLLQGRLKTISVEVADLSERVLALDAQAEIDRSFADFRAGRTYSNLHWLWQTSLLALDIFAGMVGALEAQSGPNRSLRQYLANQVAQYLEAAGVREPLRLCETVDQAILITSSLDRKIINLLLTVRGLPGEIVAAMPYRFILASGIELSGLPDDASPRSPAECAYALGRRDMDMVVSRYLSRRDLAAGLVTEAAEFTLWRRRRCSAATVVDAKSAAEIDSDVSPPSPPESHRRGRRQIGNMKPAAHAVVGMDCGLVLAGGGARGAYHAGAVRALVDHGFRFDMIAGTSIGALSGAILSAAPTLQEGYSRLDKLWDELGGKDILRSLKDRSLAETATGAPPRYSQGRGVPPDSVLDGEPIETLVRQVVNIHDLRRGIPLWVSITRVPGGPLGRSKWGTAAAGVLSGEVEWVLVNELESDEHIFEALLASAAIPVLFPPRHLNDNVYVDGGVRGNVPLRALHEHYPGLIFVVHLENGALWNRFEFPELEIVEIRPSAQVRGAAWYSRLSSLLDFDAKTIRRLRSMGYSDAQVLLNELEVAQGPRRMLRDAFRELLRSTSLMIEHRGIEEL